MYFKDYLHSSEYLRINLRIRVNKILLIVEHKFCVFPLEFYPLFLVIGSKYGVGRAPHQHPKLYLM